MEAASLPPAPVPVPDPTPVTVPVLHLDPPEETEAAVAAAVAPLIDESNATFTALLANLEEAFKGHSFNAASWVTILLSVLEEVEAVANLTGAEKKSLAIALFSALLHKLPVSPDHTALLEGVSKLALPALIDALIEVAKGKWALQTVVDAVQKNCCGPASKCSVQ